MWASTLSRTSASVSAFGAPPHLLVGDASKARERLGWVPRITFEELVTQMVDADLELLAAEHKV